MSTQKIIAGDYCLGEVVSAKGLPRVLFLPGIGESGQQLNLTYTSLGSKEATQTVLDRITAWAKPNSLVAATDQFKFNLTTLSPKHEYDNGELPAALDYDFQQYGKTKVLSNSLGGFGLFRQVGLFANLLNNIDSIVSLVSGPGMGANTAKNIAAAKVPVWFLTVEDDNKSGTTPNVTIKLHKDIIAEGGTSYLTVFKAGTWPDPHQLYFRAVPAWTAEALTKYPTTATPLGESGIANLVTEPKMTVYEFLLNASKDQPINPGKTLKEQLTPIPVSAPIPEPVVVTPAPVVVAPTPAKPVPVAKTVFPLEAYLFNDRPKLINGQYVMGNTYLDVTWEDKTFRRYTFAPTDQVKGFNSKDINGHKTFAVEFYNPSVKPVFIDRKPQ